MGEVWERSGLLKESMNSSKDTCLKSILMNPKDPDTLSFVLATQKILEVDRQISFEMFGAKRAITLLHS